VRPVPLAKVVKEYDYLMTNFLSTPKKTLILENPT